MLCWTNFRRVVERSSLLATIVHARLTAGTEMSPLTSLRSAKVVAFPFLFNSFFVEVRVVAVAVKMIVDIQKEEI